MYEKGLNNSGDSLWTKKIVLYTHVFGKFWYPIFPSKQLKGKKNPSPTSGYFSLWPLQGMVVGCFSI